MKLAELLNVFSIAFGLFVAIITFNLLLQQVVKNARKYLFFKLGLFLFFSIFLLVSPFLFKIMDVGSLSFAIVATSECIWWFSLNFLLNEMLTYFVWDNRLANKGIVVSKLLRDLVSITLIIITIACIFHFVFEKSVVGLFTASGVMAIILGYSAQATLGEAFAGVGLNITKQFDKDEWIALSGAYGKVIDINWRFVTLLTLDGNYLSIPNSQIAKEKITNYSRPSTIHGVSIIISVQNTISPETIKTLLVSAAKQCVKIATNPPPVASLTNILAINNQASQANQPSQPGQPNQFPQLAQLSQPNQFYQLSYHTTEQNTPLLTDQILSIFWYQLQRTKMNLINTPSIFPIHSVEHIQSFLGKTDLFSSLDKEEIAHLATQSTYKFYGPPEKILSQGQNNQSLFLIYKGGVDVYIETPDQKEIKTASISEGYYFGEMSLLTGEAAGASIIVNTESTIIEITHENIDALFTQRPALVEKISKVIVQRKLQNESLKASLQKNTKKEEESLIHQLASRIKLFFKK